MYISVYVYMCIYIYIYIYIYYSFSLSFNPYLIFQNYQRSKMKIFRLGFPLKQAIQVYLDKKNSLVQYFVNNLYFNVRM